MARGSASTLAAALLVALIAGKYLIRCRRPAKAGWPLQQHPRNIHQLQGTHTHAGVAVFHTLQYILCQNT
jgi:hypothetical protein